MISSSEQLMDLLLALINTKFRIGQGKIVLLFVYIFFFSNLSWFFRVFEKVAVSGCVFGICTCPAWWGGRVLDPGIRLVQRLKAKTSHSQSTENKYGWRRERWAADHLFCHLLLRVCGCSHGYGCLVLWGLLFFRHRIAKHTQTNLQAKVRWSNWMDGTYLLNIRKKYEYTQISMSYVSPHTHKIWMHTFSCTTKWAGIYYWALIRTRDLCLYGHVFIWWWGWNEPTETHRPLPPPTPYANYKNVSFWFQRLGLSV